MSYSYAGQKRFRRGNRHAFHYALRFYGLRKKHRRQTAGRIDRPGACGHGQLHRETGRVVRPGDFRPLRRGGFPAERTGGLCRARDAVGADNRRGRRSADLPGKRSGALPERPDRPAGRTARRDPPPAGGDATRPLLARPDKETAAKELYDRRLPLYRAAATHIVDAAGSPETVARAILEAVGEE